MSSRWRGTRADIKNTPYDIEISIYRAINMLVSRANIQQLRSDTDKDKRFDKGEQKVSLHIMPCSVMHIM